MGKDDTIGDRLLEQGISRRTFLKFCAGMASLLALLPSAATAMAETLVKSNRPVLIWMSFQECTGCLESLTRSFSPTLESLLIDLVSIDYQHTLMAASGTLAEAGRLQAMKENYGEYVLVIDGSIPTGAHGAYGTIAGQSMLDLMRETARGAAVVINVGTCSSFGGIPAANPNPTASVKVADIVKDKPIVNVPGCPPIPEVITATFTHYLTFGRAPDLDAYNRPLSFFGETIHDRCYRRPFYDQGKFAKTFDDEGARNGWCLYELGCKGPTTYNACATVKWNGGASFPIESGHGCIGCSSPGFWDQGGFYRPLSQSTMNSPGAVGIAAAAGVAVGAAAAAWGRHHQDGKTETKSR